MTRISKIPGLLTTLLFCSLNLSEGATLVGFVPTAPSAQYIAISQQYFYEVELFNNTDRLPEGSPADAPIDRIRLTGFYSDAGQFLRSPSFQNMPLGWTGTGSYSQIRRVDSVNKLWEMTIGTTSTDPATGDFRIMPGDSITFRVFFSVPAPYGIGDIVYGDIQAESFTTVNGTRTTLEPTVFRGPIGVVPEPSIFLLFGLGILCLVVARLSHRMRPKQ
jgi:hypothetical protein